MQTIFLLLNLITISQCIYIEEGYNTSYFDKSSIETIDDSNFDQVINAGFTNDYIILFTIKICPSCDQILKILERAAEYFSKRNSNIIFYKIDLQESIEVDLRFHFEEVPVVIYVSKGKYAEYQSKYLSANFIKNFIEDKNKVMIDLPKELGFFNYFMEVYKLVVDYIMLRCPFLKKNYYYYWVIVFIFFAWLIITSAYVFIKCCCRSSYKNKKYSYRQIKKKCKLE